MAKRRIATVLAVGLILAGFAQPVAAVSLDWANNAAKDLEATVVDPAGNVYVVGSTNTPTSYRVAYLAKFSPGGKKLWSRLWEPGGKIDGTWASDVALGDDGSVYWAGSANGRCEGGGWFVRKMSPSGRLLWHREQPGIRECKTATAPTDISVGRDIVVLSALDYGCCDNPFEDGFVMALGLNGAARWKAPFEPPNVWRGYFDRATGVAVGGFDNVYVTGWAATSKVSSSNNDYTGEVVLEKVSSGGRVLWAKRLRSAADRFLDVHVATHGDQLMVATEGRTGAIYWGTRPPSGWLARFTTGGDRVWTRTWGESWKIGAEPSQVAIDGRGGTWVAGTQRDKSDRGLDTFIRRYAPGGALTWRKVLDGPTRYLTGTGVSVTNDVVGVSSTIGTQRFNEWKAGRVFRFSA